MKYALIVYETPAHIAERDDPAKAGEYWGAYSAFNALLSEAGVHAGGAGLKPPAIATTVRVRGGERTVSDGPFAETKEQLGGFFVIDVRGLDDALKYAEQCPAARHGGSVEVRPLLEMPG